MKYFIISLFWLLSLGCHASEEIELDTPPLRITQNDLRSLNPPLEHNLVHYVPQGILESLGGNTVCSLTCITGGCLGSLPALGYLYFHLGYEITNGALAYLVAPIATGVCAGSVVGCTIGYCLKKHIDSKNPNL
jgi:hypothetical protein